MSKTREEHKKFLDRELEKQSEDFLRLVHTNAKMLLRDHHVFASFYQSMDYHGNDQLLAGRGQLILKFHSSYGVPRKGDYLTALVIEGEWCAPKNWGDLSWEDVRKHALFASEVKCLWHGKTNEDGCLICGFIGVSIEMAEFLVSKCRPGVVVVLGPHEPPIQYYRNLISLVDKADGCQPVAEMLDFTGEIKPWRPQPVKETTDFAMTVVETLKMNDALIVQGPPGTGKTFIMAQVVSKLLSEKKSVLVTALTNRALIELALKESLESFRLSGSVLKTNLSADEKLECKGIVPIKCNAITCEKGKVSLASFYAASKWAVDALDVQPFDYVIMDEASQAVYAMMAASKALGKKVVWIGDQNQLPPIVAMGSDEMLRNDYGELADGFKTVCAHTSCPSFILTRTYRLLPRSAELTSIFYEEPLISVAAHSFNGLAPYATKEGGARFVRLEMPIGEKANSAACERVIGLVGEILACQPKATVAVLSKFRESVRTLQNKFAGKYGERQNVIIDTVERVQGMTCDVCIYFIPNTMMSMSLDRALFNVATSRARWFTLIVADPCVLKQTCDKDVLGYLESTALGDPNNDCPIKASVKEMKPCKEAVYEPRPGIRIMVGTGSTSESAAKVASCYVLDTNVFVKCPDIVSRINGRVPVVLSGTVCDELDKLKTKLTGRENMAVCDALRDINRRIDSAQVRMEFSDVSLLPDDFNKKTADNQILSVALKIKEQNPILVTSDNGMQLKAKGLGVKTMALKEFRRLCAIGELR